MIAITLIIYFRLQRLKKVFFGNSKNFFNKNNWSNDGFNNF